MQKGFKFELYTNLAVLVVEVVGGQSSRRFNFAKFAGPDYAQNNSPPARSTTNHNMPTDNQTDKPQQQSATKCNKSKTRTSNINTNHKQPTTRTLTKTTATANVFRFPALPFCSPSLALPVRSVAPSVFSASPRSSLSPYSSSSASLA